jgi:tetratricopeptide (TPR) repeat protein
MITSKRNTAASNAAQGTAGTVQRCEHALELLHTHRGNASAEVDRVLADDPQNMFGHCLRAALIVLADDPAARPALAVSVTAMETANTGGDERMRRHTDAARAWLEGDVDLAAERYSAIVTDWPRDILALVVAHAFDFRFARRQVLLDRIAQVLPAWDAAVPGYASVLAMYAFGLEENGHYERAERMARRALDLDPRLAAAIHVISHVMEMQGRTREGLAFLAATEPAWREGTGFSVHLAWHQALFHLDAVNPDAALAVYDKQIAKPGASDMSVLADASALLWRLQLRSIEVGERWRLLADRWEKHSFSGVRPFYAVHAMMAFAATGRAGAAARVFDALPHADTKGGAPSLPQEALAAPFCEGLLAFTRKDYTDCVDWLVRVRHLADRCGGSLAQCDLIHLTFTEAALRARKERLASSLVAERTAQKPASLLNQLLQQRLLTMSAAA